MVIVHYPHPALRWASKPVRQINDQVRRFAREMFELMYAAKGIGLAANQVALPLQLFVLNPKSDVAQGAEERVFINPRIIERKGIVEEEEGCLSLPEIFGKPKRAGHIKVTALDLEGKPFEMEAEGLISRVIQHEVDHLQGILFTDKLYPLEKIRVIMKIREMEKKFRRSQEVGEIPSNQELVRALEELETAYC